MLPIFACFDAEILMYLKLTWKLTWNYQAPEYRYGHLFLAFLVSTRSEAEKVAEHLDAGYCQF